MQNDGDYAAADIVREKKDQLQGSAWAFGLIAIISGIAYAFWPKPFLLSLTVVMAAWGSCGIIVQMVSAAQVQAFVNTRRLSILEDKIDRILEDNRFKRDVTYRDEAMF